MGDDEMKTPPSKLRRMLYRNYYCLRIQNKKLWIYGALILLLMVAVLLLLYSDHWMTFSHRQPGAGSAQEPAPKPSAQPERVHKFLSAGLQKRNTRLFYNRVPKCGSSTLNSLLTNLSAQNQYPYTSSALLDDWFLATYEMQNAFIHEFMRFPAKGVFDRHLFFVDFTRYGQPNPIYINMIRDPTDRFISEFYFRRRLQSKNVQEGQRKWYDEDLDNCIRKSKDYDCRLVDGAYMKNMIAFFCGHDLECSNHNKRWALDEAKANVENFYTVVGILEEFDTTLRVLEHQLPEYFSGVVDLYRSQAAQDHVVNKGLNRKHDVSQEVKDMIRKNLTAEYEFYDFIRERLHYQAQLIG